MPPLGAITPPKRPFPTPPPPPTDIFIGAGARTARSVTFDTTPGAFGTIPPAGARSGSGGEGGEDVMLPPGNVAVALVEVMVLIGRGAGGAARSTMPPIFKFSPSVVVTDLSLVLIVGGWQRRYLVGNEFTRDGIRKGWGCGATTHPVPPTHAHQVH